MTKTSLDIATQALRRIGVCSLAQDPEAEDYAHAKLAMDAALGELVDQHSFVITWTTETVPDNLFLPFSDLVASEISSAYGFAGPSRSAAIGRLRASVMIDDRTDSRDTDEDGVISDEEAAAGLRAAYY